MLPNYFKNTKSYTTPQSNGMQTNVQDDYMMATGANDQEAMLRSASDEDTAETCAALTASSQADVLMPNYLDGSNVADISQQSPAHEITNFDQPDIQSLAEIAEQTGVQVPLFEDQETFSEQNQDFSEDFQEQSYYAQTTELNGAEDDFDQTMFGTEQPGLEQNIVDTRSATETDIHTQAVSPTADNSVPMNAAADSNLISRYQMISNAGVQDDSVISIDTNFQDRDAAPYGVVIGGLDEQGPETPSTLSKYRPADIVPFRGRSASSPPRCGTHYTFIANWPPQKPPTCDLSNRIDVFPPNDAPLHVWIQAYALRWGTWAADIKDNALREQVLNAVTDKMKMAWDTAITEGYYARPVGSAIYGHQRSDSDGQTPRGRKRAQSPSKLPAGFAFEGKDKLAITNGELAEHSITMEMINDRVQAKDFEAGELRYDEVLEALGRDTIFVKDWSVSFQAAVPGRNLLMYCFFAVQDSRAERARLKVLLEKFTKDGQKRNTRHRLEIAQEREFQHMALATELTIRERAQYNLNENENIGSDTASVDLTSDIEDESKSPSKETSDNSDTNSFFESKSTILELAREVLAPSTERACLEAFVKRNCQLKDFSHDGLDVGGSEKHQIAKACLGNIFAQISHLARLRRMMNGQQPAELLRIGHEIRLIRERIKQHQQKLQEVLSDDVEVQLIKGLQSAESSPEVKNNARQQRSETLPVSPVRNESGSPQETSPVAGFNAVSPRNLHSQKRNMIAAAELQGVNIGCSVPEIQSPNTELKSARNPSSGIASPMRLISTARPSTPNTDQVVVPSITIGSQAATDWASLKQNYIDEHWVPSLNAALAYNGYPPIKEPIDTWNKIKDIFVRINLSSEERNVQLRRFKSGFNDYLASKGIAQTMGKQSPTPSVASVSSPVPSHQSLQQVTATNWPSDAEILAAIPSHGIPGAQLMQKFDHRVGQHRQLFLQDIQRLAIIDQSSYMVFLRQAPPSKTRQHGLSPPQTVQGNIGAVIPYSPAPQVSVPSSLAEERPGLVKLKLNQPQSSLTIAQLPPPQDETTIDNDFKASEVNTTRGFSFRYLPHATLEQRQLMDEHIGEYVSKTCKARKRNPYGQYIAFTDPNDTNGPPIAHGFWDLQSKDKLKGVDWFYEGEDVPANWDFNAGCDRSDTTYQFEHPEDQERKQLQTKPDASELPQQPKIKLKLSKRVAENQATSQQGQAASNFDLNGILPQQFGGYNLLPPGYTPVTPDPVTSADVYRNQRAFAQNQSQTQYETHAATINPAQLMINPRPVYNSYPQMVITGQDIAAQGSDMGTKKGTKRSTSGVQGGGRKKKRKTNDDESDGDYDPNQDY